MRVLIFFLLMNISAIQAQERFVLTSGKNSNTSNIPVIGGKSVLKPYSVDLVFFLESIGKEKKKGNTFTNVISFELSQLNDLWIYGGGGLDGHYGFKYTFGESRTLDASWFPTALPSKHTIPATIKSAKIYVKYRGKTEAEYKVELSGDFEIQYYNAQNVNQYSYQIKYTEYRTLQITILENGKAVILNPRVENCSSQSDILGQKLKIKIREGF